jgi:hypothetical protein
VIDVRVDASVRDEAEEMYLAASLARSPKGTEQGIVREERAVLDRGVDAHQILEENPARPDREVPDLRVAHLPRGQPDGFS